MNYEAARLYGETHRSQIRRWLKRFAERASPATVETARVGQFLPRPEDFFTEAELQELQGIADGAGVLLANLIAHCLGNGRSAAAPTQARQFRQRAKPHRTSRKRSRNSLSVWCCG